MIWVEVLWAWYAGPLLVLAAERACLFAIEWLIPLISDPSEITFIVLVWHDGSGSVTSLLTWFCRFLRCNVLLPLLVRRSFRWQCLRSSVMSNLRAMQSSVLCLWSPWKSHHYEASFLSLGATIFPVHLIVLPMFLNTATSSVGEILRFYSSTLLFSCVHGGRSRGWRVSLLHLPPQRTGG